MAAARASRVFGDEKPLQRSSSKADAIRRGTLRISGPISTDTDFEEDGQTPDRSSVSLRVHEAITEKRSQLLRDASPEVTTAPDVEGQNQQAADSLEPPRQRDQNSVALRDTTYSNGYASTYSHPYSMNTDPNSVRVSPKDDAKTDSGRKAKGGSFRAAVRRLFGRKPKPVQSTPTRHGYHRSDPGALLRPAQTPQPSSTPQRSFSMPIRDITPSVALQSHSPAVQFPHSKELKPLDLRPTIRQHSPRRRATLGSTAPKRDNSTSLPKSFDDPFWDSIVPVEERDIGLAVTSGSNPKRRSRSAGALRDISRVQVESSGRRRSEEIRYWRASTDGRPMSGESRYSGIAFGSNGPERKVNRMHYRDASDEHAQPASPRHGRIFNFRPMNEEIEEVGQHSPDNGSGHKSVIRTSVPEGPEDDNSLLPQESTDVSSTKQMQRQTLEEGSSEWTRSQSPSLHNFYDESSQDAASPRGSGQRSGAPNVPSPNSKGHGQTPKLDPAPTLITSIPGGRLKNNAQEGGHFSGKNDVPRLDDTATYQQDVHRTPEKTNEKFGQSYAEDYIGLINRQLPPEMPSPLSPGTSTTFEAISNVLAHERAARKELERLVYDLKREVAELRSMMERRTRLSAYGERNTHDEMRTYRSHSSETMDARKTLDRLEGYGRHDDQRVTVIRSRFSGFDSVDDSNGGTADEDDRADDNDGDDDTRGPPTSSGQEEQTREGVEQIIHHRSQSAPSTDMESPSSEAFETPREEASGYAYAYDADDDDVSRKPMHSVGARVPVVVGGMF
ncbi:hypothetical protein EV356DRAFT_515495 [Viridothelium virens]|uniref:Uncharacterized protein n=1 Tax=Viridothelium virens TaxID=1048519 RepID=A0A6A6HNA5_VIRVR|nr:hypothetical protein EV356DRAFT_515495 [Viridothelium virens]